MTISQGVGMTEPTSKTPAGRELDQYGFIGMDMAKPGSERTVIHVSSVNFETIYEPIMPPRKIKHRKLAFNRERRTRRLMVASLPVVIAGIEAALFGASTCSTATPSTLTLASLKETYERAELDLFLSDDWPAIQTHRLMNDYFRIDRGLRFYDPR